MYIQQSQFQYFKFLTIHMVIEAMKTENMKKRIMSHDGSLRMANIENKNAAQSS